ncbi:MAG: type II toxin-antitoxin system RelE/ParE family toxin [Firmicutes bacterium]|nr:type II toxin-antitoxin system RelE/ParE family toxin [Bacillota bacterium]
MSGKNSRYKLLLSPRAVKKLKRLDTDIQKRIKKALYGITVMPPRGDIKKLKDMRGRCRLRVGDWRVFFLFDKANREIHVVDITQRKDAYK